LLVDISMPKPHPTGRFRVRYRGRAIYGQTPALCLAKVLRAVQQQGDQISCPPVYLAEVAVLWLGQQTSPGAKRAVKPFVKWAVDQRLRIVNLPRSVLTDYQARLQRVGYAANTIISRVSAARQVLRFAERRSWISRMPDNPRPPTAVLQYRDLSRTERVRLFWYFRSRRRTQHIWTVVRFLYWTGARPSEACAICWRMVDWTNGEVRLAVHKTSRTTGQSRTIYLTPKAVRLLKRLKTSRPGDGPDDPVFRNGRGRPLTWKAIHEAVRRASVSALGYTIHTYQLRHTFAQVALGQAPAEDVAKLLGHRGLRYVQVYAQVRDQRARRTALRLRL